MPLPGSNATTVRYRTVISLWSPQTDCDTYNITLSEDGWALSLNQQLLGSGMDQERAERAAEVAARLSVRRGRNVVVSFDDGREVALGGAPQASAA